MNRRFIVSRSEQPVALREVMTALFGGLMQTKERLPIVYVGMSGHRFWLLFEVFG